ncbi:MAG: energy-coupling factor transporter transmembrane component T [bacterium]|nr:energy-coupling factor transporter transmembrane component T [bacterium]
MKSIVIGQYIPGTSFLYKIDPRTKMIAILFLLVSVFLLKEIWQLVVGALLVVLIFMLGKLSIKRIMRGLRPIMILLIFTFIFQLLFNQTGNPLLPVEFTILTISLVSVGSAVVWTVLWRLIRKVFPYRFILLLIYIAGLYAIFYYLGYGPLLADRVYFQIYDEAVLMSVFVIIRLMIVLTLSTLLTLTTKPTDLTQGMESLMRPLKLIGVQSEEFALIISISLRYIPTILDEANKIMLAQASRGADFSEGKLKDKIKQVISLLVPMFIIAFKRSEDLADAMESRNFVPGKPRTRIHELRFGRWDIVTVCFVVVVFSLSLGLLLW